MKLYNYFRSSASFRVRIALELKGLAYEYVPVHLARGDHKKEAYAAMSADMLVPLLEVDGQRLSQCAGDRGLLRGAEKRASRPAATRVARAWRAAGVARIRSRRSDRPPGK